MSATLVPASVMSGVPKWYKATINYAQAQDPVPAGNTAYVLFPLAGMPTGRYMVHAASYIPVSMMGDSTGFTGNSVTALPSTLPGGVTIGVVAAFTYANGFVYTPASGTNTTGFYKYEVATNTWTQLTSANSAFAAQTSGVWDGNDRIYFYNAFGTPAFQAYSIAGNSWTTLTVPTAVGSPMLMYPGTGNFVYLLTGNSITATALQAYSISGNSWANLTPPPAPACSAVSTQNDYIYACPVGALAAMRYSIIGNSWTTLAGVVSGGNSAGTNGTWDGGDNIYFRTTASAGYRYSIARDRFQGISLPTNGATQNQLCYAGSGKIFTSSTATATVSYYTAHPGPIHSLLAGAIVDINSPQAYYAVMNTLWGTLALASSTASGGVEVPAGTSAAFRLTVNNTPLLQAFVTASDFTQGSTTIMVLLTELS
jgi:hypothetical protein